MCHSHRSVREIIAEKFTGNGTVHVLLMKWVYTQTPHNILKQWTINYGSSHVRR